jgi:TolA-binding protein
MRSSAALLLPLLALTACAAGRDASDRAMHEDLEIVQTQSDRRSAMLASDLPPEPQANEAPRRAPVGPPREVVRIGGAANESPRVDDPGPRPVLKVTGGRRGSGMVEAQNLEDDDGPKVSEEERALLKKADDAMRAGKHKDALEAYGRLVVLRPDGPLAEAAMLGRAAAHQAGGEPARAAEGLEALLARFPASDATPEVLARLATIHRGLGHRERASELTNRLRSEYPKSEASRRLAREDSR